MSEGIHTHINDLYLIGTHPHTHAHINTLGLLTSVSFHPVASGRYHPGKDKPDPKTWKANFRCALNSLSDIRELHEHSRKRGNNAFRVYKMMASTQPQPQRRRRGEAWVDEEERTQTGSGRSACVRGLCVCPSQDCDCSADLEEGRPVRTVLLEACSPPLGNPVPPEASQSR